MLAFWIEFKRRLKTSAVILATGGVTLLLAIAYLFTRKSKQYAGAITGGLLEHATERIAAANARAAIEVHVARTKEADVHAELKAIDAEPDGDRQRQRLVELAEQVEGRTN